MQTCKYANIERVKVHLSVSNDRNANLLKETIACLLGAEREYSEVLDVPTALSLDAAMPSSARRRQGKPPSERGGRGACLVRYDELVITV